MSLARGAGPLLTCMFVLDLFLSVSVSCSTGGVRHALCGLCTQEECDEYHVEGRKPHPRSTETRMTLIHTSWLLTSLYPYLSIELSRCLRCGDCLLLGWLRLCFWRGGHDRCHPLGSQELLFDR
jgi:hypothetical protein